MNHKHAKELLDKYRVGTCTERELAILESWYANFELDQLAPLTETQFNEIAASKAPKVKKRTVPLWKKLSVAATITILTSVGLYFYQQSKTNSNAEFTAGSKDLSPGRHSATLTLTDGRKIVLNEATNGELVKQAGVAIVKTADGRLIYRVEGNENHSANQLNTLSTARGETYEVILPDGSHVWLNAASSVTYPTSFAKAKQRKVILTGEGYFEVAKMKLPFIVESAQQQVEVLGTHFNISSYADNSVVRTTLLEGSVQVAVPNSLEAKRLIPNQQAVLTKGGVMEVVNVNGQNTISWKNGEFVFESEPLSSIMKKIERWYDVKVVYEQESLKAATFEGSLSLYDKISRILNTIAYAGTAKFRVDGRTIFVSKY